MKWSKNVMLKKVYEGSRILRFEYQTLKNMMKWALYGLVKTRSEKGKVEKGT